VAEDDYFVREGIERLLASEPSVELAGVYPDADQLLAAIDEDRPQVVIADIRMPPGHQDEGIRLAERLRETHPKVGLVVLSSYVEPRYALRVFEHGAEGRAYLLKQSLADRQEIVRAVAEVAAGGSVVDPRVVQALVEAQRLPDSRVGRLTPREVDVLRLLAEGASNERIATLLGLSKSAVEKHVNSIFSKLDLADERDASRRVKATLVYLSTGSAT
jgi:DNA-binding NarL/FixJ family response regulator